MRAQAHPPFLLFLSPSPLLGRTNHQIFQTQVSRAPFLSLSASESTSGVETSSTLKADLQPPSSLPPSPYDVLDLPFDVSESEIKKQYRKKSLMIHPDKFKHERGVEVSLFLSFLSLSSSRPQAHLAPSLPLSLLQAFDWLKKVRLFLPLSCSLDYSRLSQLTPLVLSNLLPGRRNPLHDRISHLPRRSHPLCSSDPLQSLLSTLTQHDPRLRSSSTGRLEAESTEGGQGYLDRRGGREEEVSSV